MGRRSVWLCFLICSRFAVRSVTQALNTHAWRCLQGSGYRSLIKPAFCQRANLRHSAGRESALRREARPQDGVSLTLEICEGTFCLGRERLLKTGDQSLIERSTRFGLLSRLELRHSQIKKRIGVERPFPSAFPQ